MSMDDFKLFVKNENELETLIQTVRIYSQDIGMEFSIKVRHASNERRQTTHDGGSRITKPSSHQNDQG